MGDGNAKQAMGERMAEAIERAVGLARTPAASAAARDAAQVVGLVGLERLLAALARVSGAQWPDETHPVRDRLLRLARACRAERGIEPLEQADHQLGSLAAELEALDWGMPATPAPLVTMSLGEIIGETLARTGGPDMEAVRLAAPVGAAFKAVCDWLSAPDTRMLLRLDAGVLQIMVERPDPTALIPSGRLLGAVGGCIVPATADNGAAAWRVRLPTVNERGSYLIVRQGALSIALPWHAVVGIHIASGSGEPARASELPRLDPMAPLRRAAAQPVVVVVASGLRRARFVADRLVWRFPAVPQAGGAPPANALEGAVRTDDGETHWVANPERMLAHVPEPDLGPATPVAEAVTPTGAAPEGGTPATAPQGAAPPEGEVPLPELTEADVEPLDAPAEPRTDPDPAPPPAPRGGPAPERRAPARGSRSAGQAPRALIADDAIMARRFLARLLEEAGFEVQAVPRAADLFEALGARWDLVLVDVELPDGHGADLMKGVLARRSGDRPMIVALVRDAADRKVASDAGIERTLRKPFDRETIVSLLFDLGLEADRG